MPHVTAIVPCHNDAAYLGEALQCVMGQTRPPDDIVVVDDGSTDDSAAVAASFGNRVRLIAQPHMGISAARNAGVAAATGELIAFLDADDLWPADSLQIRLEHLIGVPATDCVYGLVEQFLSPDMDPDQAGGFWFKPGQNAARHVGAMLLRRSVIERIGGFDTDVRIGDQLDFAARIADDGATTAMVDRLVMRRRIHGANYMIRNLSRHGEYLRVLRTILDRRAAHAASGAV